MENKTTKLVNILKDFKETCTWIIDELTKNITEKKQTLKELYADIKTTSKELLEMNDTFEEIADTAENFGYDCTMLNEELITILEEGASIVETLYDPNAEDFEIVDNEDEEDTDTAHIDELKAN